MDNVISQYFLPVLPIYGFVCRPGQIVSLTIKNQTNYKELFAYAQSHTYSKIAIGYLHGPRTKKPNFYQYMSIANIMEATPLGSKKSLLWKLYLTNIQTALYEPHSIDSSLPFWRTNLIPLQEEQYQPGTYSALALVKLWIMCRKMVAKADDQFSALTPSRGNRYFKGYFQDLTSLLNLLYNKLPLTFQQRVEYLGALSLDDKVAFMIDNLDILRKAGLRLKIAPSNYKELCRVNKDAADALLHSN